MSACSPRRQATVGLALAGCIVGAWLALHIAGVFFLPLRGGWLWLLPVQVLLQTWLSVGLFIVAHDAMHGSLAPGHPWANRAIGQLCVGVYAAFSYDRLRSNHHRHHARPGTADDPDFHGAQPRAFVSWFLQFFRTYFGWRELAVLAVVVAIDVGLSAQPLNLLLCWALPALLSALQLFTFGTWLPHRHHAAGVHDFADAHRARTLDWPWLVSLLACFHFGLHLEHHRQPHVPWWRLPRVRADA
ncbi:fatty acid desaturase [Ramlibacter sp. MMS24-I3-19]|uniref:fatty acid desaturase n=1 Tax=Ramlibacter sp. MMS24-I3-19 TaxID=3416606 RepID=UPI003D04A0DC